MQIGPKVFSFINTKDYVGWDTFSKKIEYTFGKLKELELIKDIKRFGLRYINLFPDTNIYEKSYSKNIAW